MSAPVTGLRAWLLQRISAVYLMGFSLYLLLHFLLNPPADHAAWLAWLNAPLVSTAWAMFFVALLLHAWVGIRDVIIDYVHSLAVRLLALSVLGGALIGTGFWLLRVLFGGAA
jgi:succinate dehydrogenase / fumarate reductase membrane anchor subunit